MTIQMILDRKGGDVFTICSSETIKNAVDQMHKRGVAALIVKSGDDTMGIVSERDVVSAISRLGERALTTLVQDISVVTKITLRPEDSIARAMRVMTLHHLRHLPVVANQRLVGIISIGDVVKHRVEDLETESNVLRDLSIARR
jgi:CBS domain-containing protein